jgi:hypothetical protein
MQATISRFEPFSSTGLLFFSFFASSANSSVTLSVIPVVGPCQIVQIHIRSGTGCHNWDKYEDGNLEYRGEGRKLLPGKTPVGKILSQISGQYFSGLFKGWDKSFPGKLRIVEFYLHKDSNYRQNFLQRFPALCAGLYVFPMPAGWDRIFPGQNKDWDRIFPRQNFSHSHSHFSHFPK